MQAPRRLQLRRGNTAAVSTYLGAPGELIVNTDNNTLYVHDGITVGGIATTVNAASITSGITAITNGTATFSNIIPGANVTYTLGNITHQWKSLYVSNNTIYINGIPLSIDNNGNLSINGNAIPTVNYVNAQVANVTVDLSGYALDANITAANVGMKGYVDQANSVQSAQITAANVGLKGYVDQANTIQSAQITAANVGLKGYVDQANTIQSTQISTANVGMKGYVDASIGNIAPAYSNANVASYLPTYSGDIGANISKAGYTWTFDTAGTLTTPGTVKTNLISSRAANQRVTIDPDGTTLSYIRVDGYDDGGERIVISNQLAGSLGMYFYTETGVFRFYRENFLFPDGSTQTTAYSNAAVSTYLSSHTDQTIGGNLTIQGNLFVNGNVNYISVNNMAIGDNIINLADLNPADSLDLGFTAHRTVNGLLQHTGLIRDAGANQWKLFSNVTQDVGTTVDFTDAIYDDLQLGNIVSPTITTINNNIAAANAAWAFANTIQSQQISAANVGIIGYIDQGNTIQAAAITSANVGMKGYVDSQSFYSNAKVATYLSVGNIANVSVAGNVTAGYFIGNGALLTGIASSSSYSNVQVATYLPTYSGNLSAGGYFGMAGADGTTVVDFQTGAATNQIITLGSNYTFSIKAGAAASNRGSLVLESGQNSRVRINGNGSNVLITAGNGTQSSTWTFANSGVLTFPDGTTQTTAASGGGSNYGNANVTAYTVTMGFTNYSNVNVKAYTESMGFANYGNANVSAYLPTHTGNVGVNYLLGTTPNVTLTAGSYNSFFDTTGNVILPNVYVTGNVTGGYIFGNGAFLTGIVTSGGSGTNYSNVNVKAYTETMGFTNYSNINVAAYISAQGITSYSNVNTKAYTESMGFTNYSNVNVAAYLSTATINTTGNITAQNISGNISIIGNVTGTSPNVTIVAGASLWTFDNTGNLTLPTNADIIGAVTFTGNVTAPYFIGNGSQLTGLPSSYSNVQVATYLPTYTGNIANIRLGVSGVITFADGTTQTTAGGSYSNVQAESFITTFSGNVPQASLAYSVNISPVILNQEYHVAILPAKEGAYGVKAADGTANVTYNPVSNRLTLANIAATNITVGNIANVRLGPSGVLTFADGTTQTTASAGGSSNYSNVNVAAYLGTGQVTVSNIKLAASGNIVFADGSVLNSAATIGGNYSNVNVAVYLPTYGGTIQSSNVQTTTANIQSTTAATNTATGALRVMGGVGVAGTVFAGQLNTTGNLIANAISAYSLNTVANVVASVVNAGTVNSTGNILAQNIVGTIATASQTGITQVGTLGTLTVSGNATVGNLVGSEANTRIIANTYVTTFDIYGNVTFPGNVIATRFIGDGSLLTGIVGGGGSSYGNANVALYLPVYAGNIVAANVWTTGNATGSGALTIGPAGYTVLPTTITQFTGNANTYTQLNLQNISTGADATAEYVATANNGTDTTFFVDMGIANSNYDVNSPNNSLGTTIYPNDSYLYAQGNLATTTGGNLAIGTSTANKSVKIFAGGINSANIVATVSNTGVAVTGNVSATGNITATGYIVTTGGYGNISQVDYITANNVVATANVTVQGIGITMPNRPAFRVNGTSLYGGTQSTANVNLKGVAVSTAYNQGSYFDATTGKFTAPIAGIYEVLLNARVNSSFNGLAQLVVLKNGLNTSGNIVAFWETSSNIGGATHFGVSGTVVLATGDYLSANILAGNVTFDQNDNWSVTYLG